jgi:hypothetical protein
MSLQVPIFIFPRFLLVILDLWSSNYVDCCKGDSNFIAVLSDNGKCGIHELCVRLARLQLGTAADL